MLPITLSHTCIAPRHYNPPVTKPSASYPTYLPPHDPLLLLLTVRSCVSWRFGKRVKSLNRAGGKGYVWEVKAVATIVLNEGGQTRDAAFFFADGALLSVGRGNSYYVGECVGVKSAAVFWILNDYSCWFGRAGRCRFGKTIFLAFR